MVVVVVVLPLVVVVVVMLVVVVVVLVVGVVVVVPPVMAVLMYALRDRRKCIREPTTASAWSSQLFRATQRHSTRSDGLRLDILPSRLTIWRYEGRRVAALRGAGFLLERPLGPSQERFRRRIAESRRYRLSIDIEEASAET